METLFDVLLVLHLLGWAVVLGGTAVSIRDRRLPRGTLHGVLTALVTGIAMAGMLSAGVVGHEPNTTKLGVKLVIALVITGLVIFGVRRPRRVTTGLLGAIAGLTVVNVAIAVLWH
jgi:hypothetical protein